MLPRSSKPACGTHQDTKTKTKSCSLKEQKDVTTPEWLPKVNLTLPLLPETLPLTKQQRHYCGDLVDVILKGPEPGIAETKNLRSHKRKEFIPQPWGPTQVVAWELSLFTSIEIFSESHFLFLSTGSREERKPV